MTTALHPGIDHLSASSRIWIFQSSKLLTNELIEKISEELGQFLSGWAAHGAQLFSGFEILHNRFIIIAVDENHASATGCSIDKLMRLVQRIDNDHKLDLLNRLKVAYVSGSEVLECDVNQFRALLASGKLNENTLVFNNLVQDISEWRANWRTTVAKSWHANLLP
jgi:hypothetical protein